MESNKALPGIWELIKQTLSLYSKNYRILILIGLVPVTFELLSNLVNISSKGLNNITFIIISFIIGIIGFLLQVIFQVSSIKAISEIDNGASVTIKGVYEIGSKLLLPSIWISILSSLIILGASVFFIIPGAVLAIYFTFSSYTMVLDNKRGLDSLTTSRYYLRTNLWQIIWRFIGPVVIIAIPLLIFSVLLSIILISISHAPSISSNIFQYNSLLASVSSIKSTTGFMGLVFGLISNFIILCFFYPVSLIYAYLIYKNVKTNASEPNKEIDLDRSNKLFKRLSIFGLVVFIALIIGIFLMGFDKIYKKYITDTDKVKQAQTQSLAKDYSKYDFPKEATILAPKFDLLGEKAYTNKDLGFSINIPKDWKINDSGKDKVLFYPESNNADILILKVNLSSEENSLTEDVLMKEIILSGIKALSNNSITDVVLNKYDISSQNVYSFSSNLTTNTNESINASFYYLKIKSDIYTIVARFKNGVEPSISKSTLDSVSTFKVLNN